MRLFLALNLPEELRHALHAAAGPLREAVPRGIGWARPEALHLTLKFLGDVESQRMEALVPALRDVAGAHVPVRLALRGVGAFPSLARPRVVWLGIEATPRLELLQHDLEAACARHGFEVEGRPFRPHITLGRVRPGATPASLAALAVAAGRCDATADVVVESVDVMESTLLPGGARHELRARLPLREG